MGHAGEYETTADEAPEAIEADVIYVEIIDKNTGIKYQRNLPVNYLENNNGIALSGETLEGVRTTIALLSDTAVSKFQELFGKGPDAPQHHAPEKKPETG